MKCGIFSAVEVTTSSRGLPSSVTKQTVLEKHLFSWMTIFQITPPCFSLVVGVPTYPSEKWWSESQWWWNSQYMESHNPAMFQTTNQIVDFKLPSLQSTVVASQLQPQRCGTPPGPGASWFPKVNSAIVAGDVLKNRHLWLENPSFMVEPAEYHRIIPLQYIWLYI